MRLLELFSGTHSVGKVAEKKGFTVTSLDRDLSEKCPFDTGYKSKKHFKMDIMDFDYKQFEKGHFDLITASPVCLWWSHCRVSNIGKVLKCHTEPLSHELIMEDIEKYGIPMIDRVLEIIEYLEPKHFWIENPQTGKMKDYLNDLIPYTDVDYCKYGFDYRKRTRIWTDIPYEGKLCKKDCPAIVKKGKLCFHRSNCGNTKYANLAKDSNCGNGRNSKLERYRLPEPLIYDLLNAVDW